MKLKQLFCRHKKLTSVDIASKPLGWVYIICKCDRCQKEFEYYGYELQDIIKAHKKQINTDNVINDYLWGKWW